MRQICRVTKRVIVVVTASQDRDGEDKMMTLSNKHLHVRNDEE